MTYFTSTSSILTQSPRTSGSVRTRDLLGLYSTCFCGCSSRAMVWLFPLIGFATLVGKIPSCLVNLPQSLWHRHCSFSTRVLMERFQVPHLPTSTTGLLLIRSVMSSSSLCRLSCFVVCFGTWLIIQAPGNAATACRGRIRGQSPQTGASRKVREGDSRACACRVVVVPRLNLKPTYIRAKGVGMK